MTHALHTAWKKSRRCGESGNCVEVAVLGGAGVGLRNSVVPQQQLVVSAESFREFLAGVKSGEFDLAGQYN